MVIERKTQPQFLSSRLRHYYKKDMDDPVLNFPAFQGLGGSYVHKLTIYVWSTTNAVQALTIIKLVKLNTSEGWDLLTRLGIIGGCNKMAESSLFGEMMTNLRATCKYYTGYPKDLGPSKVIHFTSERQFVQLLHEGYPVVVAFTIKGNYTKHLDKVIEESAAKFYPDVKFMRVECPKYPGFCISRQQKEYPFIEIFHSPSQASSQGRVADPNITKYSVKVLPFNYDLSAYGFREFFKLYSILSSDKK